jgi:endonuclease YncB( thermonuclease family)
MTMTKIKSLSDDEVMSGRFRHRAATNCVVDGDTIWYGGAKIRLASIDAPELHDYKCASELALGERSKRRLLELINAGPFEVVKSGSRDIDKYGRKLRDIKRNGTSLGDVLIAEGLAARWGGQHHAWC